MQPAPPVTVTLRTGPAWQAAAWSLGGLALAVGAGWAWLKGGSSWLLPLAIVALFGFGLRLLRRRPPRRLRWDGHDWWLGPAAAGPADDRVGSLVVALDLGSHLLLRFDAAAAAKAVIQRSGRHWLAVSRQTTVGDWHGLRCALHSPGPAGAAPAAADPPS